MIVIDFTSFLYILVNGFSTNAIYTLLVAAGIAIIFLSMVVFVYRCKSSEGNEENDLNEVQRDGVSHYVSIRNTNSDADSGYTPIRAPVNDYANNTRQSELVQSYMFLSENWNYGSHGSHPYEDVGTHSEDLGAQTTDLQRHIYDECL